MKKAFTIFIFVLVFLVLFSPLETVRAQEKFRPSKKNYKRADKILKKMTVDEKIGQLVHIGINAKYMNQDSAEFIRLKRQVTDNKIGGFVIFAGGVYETVHFLNRMQESAEIPLLIAADFETGIGMRFKETVNFPWNMAIAATGNPTFANRMGKITAREARAFGVHQVYAPVVDINNNAANPVINVRSFGEDPLQVTLFGIYFSHGLQSGNVLATAKHFPGHGDTAVDSHLGLPVINHPRSRFESIEFLPFRKLIQGGVGAVMISHISMPQLDSEIVKPLKNSIKTQFTENEVETEGTTIPATLSKKIVNDILLEEMDFDGLVVTDAMDMSGLTKFFHQDEAAVRAVLAGNDVILKPASAEKTISGIKKAVSEGRISKKRLDLSARKILAWKYKLGIFDRKISPIDEIDKIVSNEDSRKLAKEISESAITLVKNADSLLPIEDGKKAVLLSITNGKDIDTAGQTFAAALKNNGLRIERIGIDDRSTEKDIEKALAKTVEADVVIAGLFGRVRSGGKNSVGLPKSGEILLTKVLKAEVPVVSIAFGNPYLILGFPEMKNYIVAYGDMVSLQRATANTLVGKSEFKGRLPITIGTYKIGARLSLSN